MTATDAVVERILTSYDTITVVGASAASFKAAHSVPAHMQRHGWRIIPVNLHADQILGEPVYRTLGAVPEQVGLVDVFRPSEQTPDIARQAVAAGATALWLQLGIACVHDDVVPHLTVSDRPPGGAAELRAAEADLLPALPVSVNISRVWLMCGAATPDSWRTVAEFPLGGP